MEEKKLPQDEKISRGEFFGLATKKTKEVALNWVEKFLAPISSVNEELTGLKEKGTWIELAKTDEVTRIPKMVITQGKGYFIIKDNENQIKVIYGMCSEDGFVMNYLPKEDGLYCASCQTIYYLHRAGQLEEGRVYASEVTAKVEDNKIYIHLEA